jgi:hypothetical protein
MPADIAGVVRSPDAAVSAWKDPAASRPDEYGAGSCR